MGKIISNGIEYGGLINIEGAFIDTNNIIDSGTYISTFSYTATEDCYMFALLVATSRNSSSAAIDGEDVGNVYSATSGAIQKDVLVPLRKGQVFTINNSEPWSCSYSVYGIQSGSHTKGLPDYSTTEQKTGQKWIDGKDIYQKTIHITSGLTTGDNNYAHNISDIEQVINFEAYTFGGNGGISQARTYGRDISHNYTLDVQSVDNTNIFVWLGSNYPTSSFNIYVTIKYTKSTT